MGKFSKSVATHTLTSEVEVIPPGNRPCPYLFLDFGLTEQSEFAADLVGILIVPYVTVSDSAIIITMI